MPAIVTGFGDERQWPAGLTRYAARVLARIAILVTLVACNDQDAERLTAIKSKVCACKTASCAEHEMKLVPEQPIKSTHRTQGIARELLDCVARLQEAERPSTDPDDEGTGEPPAGEPPPGAPPTIAPPLAAPPTSPRTADPASARKP
jgi:hypothetical protein